MADMRHLPQAPQAPPRQASPYTPRVWAAPLRSSSLPRVGEAHHMPLVSGATTPLGGTQTPRLVVGPYLRPAVRPQFVRLEEARPVDPVARLEKALQEQREEHEVGERHLDKNDLFALRYGQRESVYMISYYIL